MGVDFSSPARPKVKGADGNLVALHVEFTPIVNYAADGAIDIGAGDIFRITKGSAAAMTLADPVEADNGRTIIIVSGSAFAHTITVAGGIGGAGATDDVITFTNRKSASITLKALNTKWYVVGGNLAAIA